MQKIYQVLNNIKIPSQIYFYTFFNLCQRETDTLACCIFSETRNGVEWSEAEWSGVEWHGVA